MPDATHFAKLHFAGLVFLWRACMTEVHRVGVLWFFSQALILFAGLA